MLLLVAVFRERIKLITKLFIMELVDLVDSVILAVALFLMVGLKHIVVSVVGTAKLEYGLHGMNCKTHIILRDIMKKPLPFIAAFLLFSAVTLPAQQLVLDEVVKRAARGVEEVLPQRTLVAVLNFASTSETFSDYVMEELTGELVMGRKVTIVDRRSLALISQEMNLQLSGDVSDESAQAIGR